MAVAGVCPLPPDQEHHGDALLGRCLAGRFQLRSVIGAGSSGCVYRAEQLTLRRDVAIKVLNPRLASDPEFVERLYHEALAASRLNHPNTVSIIDFGQSEDGLFFIVMEYLRGRTLTALKHQRSHLSLERVIDIVVQILHGLHEAHAAGVIHADLKSDNIMVEELRSGDLVKVVDFGIARLLDPLLPIRGRRVQQSQPKICGTPEYMAPEVIRGGKPEQASDIYAVGVVLYELLAGCPPFVDENILGVLRRHLVEPVLPLARLRPDIEVPAPLEAAVLRALAKDPADRFDSAVAFRTAIESAMMEASAAAQIANGARADRASARSGGEVMDALIDVDTRGTTIEMPTAELPRELIERAADTAFDGKVPGRRTPEAATVLGFCLGGGPWDVLQIAALTESQASRVVRETIDLLGEGVTLFVTGADPLGMARPWYPIRELMAAALSLPSTPGLRAVSGATARLGHGARDAVDAIFGMPGKGTADGFVQQQGMRALAGAVREIIRTNASGSQQIMVVFESVHRYDAASIELVRALCASGFDANMRGILTTVPPFDIDVPRKVAPVALSAQLTQAIA